MKKFNILEVFSCILERKMLKSLKVSKKMHPPADSICDFECRNSEMRVPQSQGAKNGQKPRLFGGFCGIPAEWM
jgi:hypothetical protein